MELESRCVVFGLGSNLGDRVEHVRSAVSSLRALLPSSPSVRSGLYETVPIGGPVQGDYINAALLVHTDRRAQWLLDKALEIERAHGRVRRERNGPRTLDIDLLWIEEEVLQEPHLTVPHPRLLERAFAMVPLLEAMPDARDPRSGKMLTESMAGLDTRGVRKLSPPFSYPSLRSCAVPLDTQAWKC